MAIRQDSRDRRTLHREAFFPDRLSHATDHDDTKQESKIGDGPCFPILRFACMVLAAQLLASVAVAAEPTVTLAAKEAGITGSATYYTEGDFVGAWRDPKATLQWELTVNEDSTANVELVHSCAPNCGGKFQFEVGPHKLAGQTRVTGNWNKYEAVPLGAVKLAAGRYTVTLRADGPFQGALMNVREIRLSPVKGSAKKFAAAPAPLPKQVFIVPNFHPASCGWLANWSDERNYCANNYLLHLDRVRDDANYALAVSEVNNMIAILNFTPDRFAEMKRRIQEGRVEPVNAFFLEPTVSLSGGEALAKMGIEGLRWQENMLGVRPRYCWAIDTCGIHDQMPQICSLLGLDALVYNRCARPASSVFWSESPDGSRILTLSIGTYAHNLGGLWPTKTATTSPRYLEGVARAIGAKRPATPAGLPMLILGGHGDYSQPPANRENPTAFLDAWKQARPDCEIRFAGLTSYMNALWPVVKSGSVPLETLRAGTGYAYGSFWINAPSMRAWFRRDEHALQAAEMLATIASLKAGSGYPAQPFYHAWLQMLLNMDRNSLWGAAAGMVFEDPASWDIKDRLEWVEKQSAAASAQAVRALAGTGDQTVLFNPLNWQRSDVPDLPACGLGPATAPGPAQEIALPPRIETPFYLAQVDPRTGALVSLKSKPSGREMLGGPANVLVAEKQTKAAGNVTNPRPARQRLASSSDFKTILTVTESASALTVEARSDFAGGGACRRITRFSKIHPRIEFETELDEVPDLTVVVVEFPLAQAPDEIRRGIPFGFSRDDNYVKGIVPAVRWCDYATSGKGGVALLDRGLSGREINGNVPVLYLLNAVQKYSGYPSAWTSGKGRHTFEYALVAHDADWPAARIPQRAWEYNCPPVAVAGCRAGPPESFLKTSDNLIVEAMRRDGADIELRLVESIGVSGLAEVTLHLPHESAALTDLVGGHAQKLAGGPTYKFPVKPQQIVTVRFKTAQRVPDVVPLTKWDELVPVSKRAALNHYKPNLTGHPPHDVDLQTDQGNQSNK